jgi:hypothetical protein
MTAIQGEYLKIHRRTYVHLNPKPAEGPFTWNLSNKAGSTGNTDDISAIYTTLPIDSVTDSSGAMKLFFNIEALDNVEDSARFLTGPSAVKRLLDMPIPLLQTQYDLASITAIKPVVADEFNTAVVISFDIKSLPPLTTIKSSFRVRSDDYNSRSTNQLTADKPLFSTGGENPLITFDISSLDPA